MEVIPTHEYVKNGMGLFAACLDEFVKLESL